MAQNLENSQAVSNLLFPQQGGAEEEPVETTEEPTLEQAEESIETATDDTPDDDTTEENSTPEEDTEGSDEDITTLSALANATEVDESFLYGLKIALPDEGGDVSLSELKDAFVKNKRLEESANKSIEDYTNKQQQLEQQYHQVLNLPIEVAKASADVDRIQANYQSVDWEKLKAEDSNRYVLLKTEYQDAFNAAQQRASVVMNQYQHVNAQQSQERLQQAHQQMMNDIPEWKSPEVFESEAKEIANVLNEYGISQNEVNNIIDPRQVRIARDLMMLRKEKGAGKETLKKVRNKPKILKPGVSKSAQVKKKEQRSEMLKKAKKGSKADKSNAVRELLYGT